MSKRSCIFLSHLERNIRVVITSLILFYIITQISPAIPSLFLSIGFIISSALGITMNLKDNIGLSLVISYLPSGLSSVGGLIGVLIGLPFLLNALRAIRPIIPVLSRKLQEGLKD